MPYTLCRKGMAKKGRNGLKKKSVIIVLLACLIGTVAYAVYLGVTVHNLTTKLKVAQMTVFDVATFDAEENNKDSEANIKAWSKYQVKIDQNMALMIGDAILTAMYGRRKYDTVNYSITDVKDKDVYIISRGTKPKEEGIYRNQIGQTVVISKTDGHVLGYYGMPFSPFE